MKKLKTYLLFVLAAMSVHSYGQSVTSVLPEPGTTTVSINSDITVSFSQPMDLSTINFNNVAIHGSESGLITFSVDGADNPNITFIPDNPFLPGETIEVTITSLVRTNDNTLLLNPYVFKFSVATSASPRFLSIISKPVTTATGNDQVAAGDFNMDGITDVVVTEPANDQLEVFLGDGAGEFNAIFTINSVVNPLGVLTADFDKDGILDLVTSSPNAASLNVFFGDGLGRFADPQSFDLGTTPVAYDIGDLNGDGFIDVAVVTEIGDVFVLENRGSRNLVLSDKTNVVMDVPSDLHIDDFTNTGNLKIYISDDANTIISEVPYDPSGFSSSTDILISETPSQFEFIDLNNDGLKDLISLDNNLLSLRVVINEGLNFSNISFSVDLGVNDASFITTDIDGDTNTDIIISTGSAQSVNVHYGDGAANFSDAQVYSSGAVASGIIQSDIDNDGDVDIINGDLIAEAFTVFQNGLSEPNVQSNNLVFSNAAFNSIDVSWTNGDGDSRLVLVKENGAVDSAPDDGVNYTANSSFSLGSQIGTGNYVTYVGTGNTFTLSGLTKGNTYSVQVFEFNSGGGSTDYLTVNSTGNPSDFLLDNEISIHLGTDENGPEIIDGTVNLDLGVSKVGTPLVASFTIYNSGILPLDIESVNLTGTDYSLSGYIGGTAIAPGATEIFTLTLDGTVAGIFNGSISMNNDDLDEAPYDFTVVGRIAEPEIQVFEGTVSGTEIISGQIAPVDMGTGVSLSETITILNSGPVDLVVTDVLVATGEFTVTGGTGVLGPGATTSFTIQNTNSTPGIYNYTINILNDDPDESTFIFRGGGEIITAAEVSVFEGSTIGGATVNSGQVTPVLYQASFGSAFNASFTILNEGNIDLVISSVLTGSADFSVNTTSATIAPGTSQTITISTTNTVTGIYSTDITLNTNDPDEGVFIFPVSMEITAPEVQITINGSAVTSNQATSVDLGTGTEGTPYVVPVIIDNTGTEDLVISDIIFSSSDYSSDITAPLTIAPGTSETVNITLPAATKGVYSSTVELVTNDPDEGSFLFTADATIQGPEIAIYQGTDTSVPEATSPINLDASSPTTTYSQVFTIVNQGDADLILSEVITTNASFVLTPPSSSVLAPGELTTFTIEYTTTVDGTYTTDIQITSNDSDESSIVFNSTLVVARPEIALFQGADTSIPEISGSIDLGSIRIGESISETFTILNTGNADLIISDILSSNPDFTISNQTGGAITAGTSGTFAITYDASADGTFSATITISNNDLDESTKTFDILLVVETPVPEINVFLGSDNTGSEIQSGQVNSVDVGEVTEGTVLTTSFTLTNTGDAELLISSVDIIGNFILNETFPQTIPPLGSFTFSVSLDAVEGIYNSTLTLANNDADEGAFTFEITARINPPPIPELSITFDPDNLNQSVLAGQVLDVGSSGFEVARTLNFVLENTGAAELVINDITIDDVLGILVTNEQNNIAPGGTSVLSVSIPGTLFGSFSSLVVINSNDPTNSPFNFTVEGEVLPPNLLVREENQNGLIIEEGAPIVFGRTPSDVSLGKTFIIENNSDQILEINSITVDDPRFDITSIPTQIPPNSSVEIIIEFGSTELGEFTGNVLIETSIGPYNFVVIGEVVGVEVINGVSPNGDGVNDVLRIRNIDFFPENTLTIFSRWGDRIFQTESYNNTSNYFSGITNVGSERDVQNGTYYYVLRYSYTDSRGEERKLTESGYFLIRR